MSPWLAGDRVIHLQTIGARDGRPTVTPPSRRCPSSGKRSFATVDEARVFVEQLRASTTAWRYAYAYGCRCGCWHLTRDSGRGSRGL